MPSLNYLGSSKDIKTRTDFFKRNNISFISLKTIRGDRMLKAILKVVFLKLIKKKNPNTYHISGCSWFIWSDNKVPKKILSRS